MSSPTESTGSDRSELPILTHTRVLGVDIAVKQRDQNGIRVQVLGRDAVHKSFLRRGLAAWARRNLFEGAGPR